MNTIVSTGIKWAYIGSIPGAIVGLFLGEVFNCSWAILFWVGGFIFVPILGVGLAFITSRILKRGSGRSEMLICSIGGFIVGVAVGLIGIPVGC